MVVSEGRADLKFITHWPNAPMRSFSTACKRLHRSKHADLAFLQQANDPPGRISGSIGPRVAAGAPSLADIPPSFTETSPKHSILLPQNGLASGQPSGVSNGLPTTRAMKLLMNAVKHRQFAAAEKLFDASPRLSERPAALRLLIKMYCEQLDFTTAKAVLFASLDKVGEVGCARFVAHVTYQSQNAEDIEEVLLHASRKFGAISPALASTALCGLRFLGRYDAFERSWALISRFWEPAMHPATLRAKVLDALLNEDWPLATKLWNTAQGLISSAGPLERVGMERVGMERSGIEGAGMEGAGLQGAGPVLRVWYMALRYFLAENPNIEAVDRVLLLMREQGIEPTSAVTDLLLRHLAPMFPEMSSSAWVRYARDRSWPLDGTAVETVIAYSYGGGLRARFGEQISRDMMAYAVATLHSHGMSTGQRSVGEGFRFRSDIASLSRRPPSSAQDNGSNSSSSTGAGSSARTGAATVLDVLKSMLKRGLRIRYVDFVHAFEQIVRHCGSDSDLREIVALIRSHDYPLHCAGTDLSMVERHCREACYDRGVCERLLSEYLAQYPLVSHDLPQLTRLAVVLTNCGAHDEAISVVDGLRARAHERVEDTQDGQDRARVGGRFSAATHDSASLQVMASAKFRLHEPLAPFLRGVVADAPNIYFDRLFRRKVRRMLVLRNEDLEVLDALERANEEAVAACYREIDATVELAVS